MRFPLPRRDFRVPCAAGSGSDWLVILACLGNTCMALSAKGEGAGHRKMRSDKVSTTGQRNARLRLDAWMRTGHVGEGGSVEGGIKGLE